MKNRFRKEWTDRQEIEQTINGQVEHSHTHQINATGLSKQIEIDPVLSLPEVNESQTKD
jgi:hypothetical protein